MASKVKKGFLYYLAWIAFLTFGIFCIFAVVLIFNPGKDVFGINFKYVSDSKSERYNTVMVNGSEMFINQLSISTININAGFTDIEIKTISDYENVTFLLKKNIVGFSSSENITYAFRMNYENNALNINITEPELSLKLAPNAKLSIFCPKNYSFANYNFNITTESGSIHVGTSDGYDLNVNNLNIESKTGAIKVRGKTNVSSGTVNIKSETSEIDVYANIKSNLNINTKSSKIYVEAINGNLNLKTTELRAKCDRVLGNISFASSKGFITVEELGTIGTQAGGNFSAAPDSMHIANVIINKIAGDISLPNAEKSDIKINEIHGDSYINTTSGNVEIAKSYGVLTINTTIGDITFVQLSNERTDINTKSGKIFANFNNISSADLKTESGNVTVNFNPDLRIVVNYSTIKNISASWITMELEKSGTILTPNTTEDSKVIMNITTEKGGSISLSNTFSLN